MYLILRQNLYWYERYKYFLPFHVFKDLQDAEHTSAFTGAPNCQTFDQQKIGITD